MLKNKNHAKPYWLKPTVLEMYDVTKHIYIIKHFDKTTTTVSEKFIVDHPYLFQNVRL